MWDTKSVVDEETRVSIFVERHGTFPDPEWVASSEPAYVARMKERYDALMAETNPQLRWDGWMFLAQAWVMPKFTHRQWDVVKAPKAVHDKLLARYHEHLPQLIPERLGGELSGVRGPIPAKFFAQEELNYEILWELMPMFEEWAGVELEPTSVYGVRVYQVSKCASRALAPTCAGVLV